MFLILIEALVTNHYKYGFNWEFNVNPVTKEVPNRAGFGRVVERQLNSQSKCLQFEYRSGRRIGVNKFWMVSPYLEPSKNLAMRTAKNCRVNV